MGINLGEVYANAIHQLLPKGQVWQEKGVCTATLLGRWIRGNSEELARFQVWFDTLLKWSIERYGETPTGWSAEEYEALIKQKFGLTVAVEPSTAANDPHMPAVDPRNRYRFVIDVNASDLGAIDSVFRDYLKKYKQSHTEFWIKATESADLLAAPSGGIMAIKFDDCDTISVGAQTNAYTGVSCFMHAQQQTKAG